MDNAAFRLETYHFVKASLNFDIPDNATLNIGIEISNYQSSDWRILSWWKGDHKKVRENTDLFF